YIFCILLFLFNGAYCTIIKMQTIYHNEEKQSMIMITFALMGIIALINLINTEKGSTLQAFKLNQKCLPSLLLCLISATLAINLLMYILPLIDTAILYTVQNGGVLILSALYSVFLFKEKLSLKKILGITIAVISITILSV
ncbi:MAG: EamA family transporter, partial [Lachnospiraceae bacterium]|nr:EamA family transporter [Lachnospiraceae bacterium]